MSARPGCAGPGGGLRLRRGGSPNFGALRTATTPGRRVRPRALLRVSSYGVLPVSACGVGGGRAAPGLQPPFVRRHATSGRRGDQAARERVRKPGGRALDPSRGCEGGAQSASHAPMTAFRAPGTSWVHGACCFQLYCHGIIMSIHYRFEHQYEQIFLFFEY